jgi:hypothetical protein
MNTTTTTTNICSHLKKNITDFDHTIKHMFVFLAIFTHSDQSPAPENNANMMMILAQERGYDTYYAYNDTEKNVRKKITQMFQTTFGHLIIYYTGHTGRTKSGEIVYLTKDYTQLPQILTKEFLSTTLKAYQKCCFTSIADTCNCPDIFGIMDPETDNCCIAINSSDIDEPSAAFASYDPDAYYIISGYFTHELTRYVNKHWNPKIMHIHYDIKDVLETLTQPQSLNIIRKNDDYLYKKPLFLGAPDHRTYL